MDTIINIVFWLSVFIIFWAMIGYNLSLSLIDKLYKTKKQKDLLNDNQLPTVTIMVVAHNEEKVIEDKLKNIFSVNYPKSKIKYIISSDHSTDNTNQIVSKFIDDHNLKNMCLYEVSERKGKLNAQNEAQKLVDTELLVMTDANSIIDKDAIRYLVSHFSDSQVSYVCGMLTYINEDNDVANSESGYWNLENKLRLIESNVQTITAGNGALYACRTSEYLVFDPIKSHDFHMPVYYSLEGKLAKFEPRAKVYEKAGEKISDEYKRKVRMNRILIEGILPDIRIFNFFKNKWFSYFYFGHRTCRYLLWLAHALIFITSFLQISSYFYAFVVLSHIVILLVVTFNELFNLNNKLINFIKYYSITIIAQFHAVWKAITKQNKPFWEKAESTR